MITRELYVFVGAIVLVAFVTMMLHERHYRERRWPILEAQIDGLGTRVRACERILTEERDS